MLSLTNMHTYKIDAHIHTNITQTKYRYICTYINTYFERNMYIT